MNKGIVTFNDRYFLGLVISTMISLINKTKIFVCLEMSKIFHWSGECGLSVNDVTFAVDWYYAICLISLNKKKSIVHKW